MQTGTDPWPFLGFEHRYILFLLGIGPHTIHMGAEICWSDLPLWQLSVPGCSSVVRDSVYHMASYAIFLFKFFHEI